MTLFGVNIVKGIFTNYHLNQSKEKNKQNRTMASLDSQRGQTTLIHHPSYLFYETLLAFHTACRRGICSRHLKWKPLVYHTTLTASQGHQLL